VDVRDAVSVTPGEDGRIDAGKGQVPGVEKQGDTVARRRHQAVDFRLAFDHSSDVVVVDEADPAPRQALGKVGQPAAEIAPAAIAEPRAAGQRAAPIAGDASARLRIDQHSASHRNE
jgi:hypothetical protein